MKGTEVIGANGVAIPQGTHGDAGFRTYEVHQRERVGQSTAKIKPIQLISAEFAREPLPAACDSARKLPLLSGLAEQLLLGLRATNDATSIFTDDANFETRLARLDDGGWITVGEI